MDAPVTIPCTVLLVDDCCEDREVYRSYLKQDSRYIYTIHEFEMGSAGLEWCQHNQPDLVLLDYSLPDMSGLEFLHEFAQSPMCHVPVILLTGEGSEEIAVEAMQQSMVYYSVKDRLTAEKLAGVIGRILERSGFSETLVQRERQQLTDIANSIPGTLYSTLRCTNGQFVHLYISEGVKQLVGLSPEAVIAQPDLLFSVIHPDDRCQFDTDLQLGLEQSQTLSREYRVISTSGAVKWVQDICTFHRLSNGDTIGNGLCLDITDRKQNELERQRVEQELHQLNEHLEERIEQRTVAYRQAEAELRQVKDRLEYVLSSAPGAIYTCEAGDDYRTTFISGNVKALFGYEASDYYSPNFWFDRIHPADVPHTLDHLTHLFEQGYVAYEYRFRHADGTYRWVYDLSRVVRDDQGNPIELVGYWLDINDRKTAEAALRESEERFRGIFEQSPIGIAMSEVTTGKFIRVNSMFSQITGYSTADLLQMSYLDITHPDDLYKEYDLNHQVLNQNLRSASVEKRYVARSGDIIWVNVVGTVVCDATGEPLYVLGAVENINDRKQLEIAQKQIGEHLRQTNEQLVKANAELAHATRLKDDFLANMSHELRTPLNAVLGMTEGLQDGVFGAINDRQKKALVTVENSAMHLLELINDLLDLSKIETDQLELHPAPTSVKQLCEASVSVVKQQALEKHITLQTLIQPGLDKITVDERRMRQVLINLLDNAVKFTSSEGRVILKVWLEQENDHQCINFSVSDTGIGIAPEQQSKLFQPFVQVDSSLSRQYSGTGLGLALVHRLVELHSGCVTLTSNVNCGSCFTVRLPYIHPDSGFRHDTESRPGQTPNCQEEPQEIGSIDQHPESPERPESSELPLILLAEDEPANVETFCSYLTVRGYHLIVARDGREAVALAKRHKPDLIVMDIQMPHMDGIEASQQIRTDQQLQQIPIIALTALAMPDDRERCLQAGLDDYLTKPLRLKHLAEKIQQFLNRSRL